MAGYREGREGPLVFHKAERPGPGEPTPRIKRRKGDVSSNQKVEGAKIRHTQEFIAFKRNLL